MPFITIHTGATLSRKQKEALAGGLGKGIAIVPGKTFENLMLTIHDGLFMAFGAQPGDKCLHMDVKMYKQSAMEDKRALVALCTDLAVDVCGVSPDNVYITVSELDNWGVGGRFI